MAKRSLYRPALLSKLAEEEKQFKRELAKTFLEYLETLSLKKRIQEIEYMLYETEVKRIVTLDQRLTAQEKKCAYYYEGEQRIL